MQLSFLSNQIPIFRAQPARMTGRGRRRGGARQGLDADEVRGGAGRPGTNARPGTAVAAAQAGERGSRGTPGRRRSEIGEVSERKKGNCWGRW